MGVIEKMETREWLILENEGQKIFAVMHLPPVSSPPIVITMHGFASHKVGTGRSNVSVAEGLCAAGIACLRFDFRGCGDSEGNLSEMSLESFISDGLSVINHLQKEGFSSIGLYGTSFGGAVSILTAERCRNIRTLVNWAPVASGELWFKDHVAKNPQIVNLDPSQAFATFRGIKLNPLFREQFRKMFAYLTLEKLSHVPYLHFHGEKDEVLSLQHQKMFQKYRVGASAPTRFITYPEAGHALGHSKVLPEVIQETVRWFKQYL